MNMTSDKMTSPPPPPPPGLPSLSQRVKSLQLVARARPCPPSAKLTRRNTTKSSTQINKQGSDRRLHHRHRRDPQIPSVISVTVPSEITFSKIPYKQLFGDEDDEEEDIGWPIKDKVGAAVHAPSNMNQSSIFRERRSDISSGERHRSSSQSSSKSAKSESREEMTTKQIWNLRGRTVEDKEGMTLSRPIIEHSNDVRTTPSRQRFMRNFFRRSSTKRALAKSKDKKTEI